ncbi:uncharacterized protein GGS25DRAFT_523966 [Hypoxylon fragiforme]|uniref:uncharacterized protein n=1 Tax=Hypoxylon fragiforme TaxID=63214 RepID=UPI0020C5EB3A|nr:uncharacterized protein GGS25DRAFT_523966 [Hypoxylon fragiforme]KAI2606302.1 hypothetical protein GGS25DRAFT_523966 [Hypoxylon fragiforme]
MSKDNTKRDAESLSTSTFNDRATTPLALRGAVEPGGVDVSFKGTVQEIDAQVHRINPNFSWRDFKPSPGRFSKSPRKRSPSKVLCHVQGLPPAPRAALESSRDWLNALAAELSVDAQRCTKVSCVAGAAVWFCNDNLGWIQEVSLTLATHVDAILDQEGCGTAGNSSLVQGQSFDSDNYNIIVNGDECA